MNHLSRKIIKASILARTPLYLRALRYGVAAAIEHSNALRQLRPRTVIDVGANKGQFSLVARRLFPDAKIYAFEPLDRPSCSYEKIFGGDPAVVLYKVALGSKQASTSIHVSGREDSSSLLEILPRQSELYPGTEAVETQQITVARGDDLIIAERLDTPILIKLDIQGYEKAALLGMPLALERASYVYAEISFQELYANQVLAGDFINFMQEKNYLLSAIYNLSTDDDGQPVYADALFIRHN